MPSFDHQQRLHCKVGAHEVDGYKLHVWLHIHIKSSHILIYVEIKASRSIAHVYLQAP